MHKMMFPSESCNSVSKGSLHSANSVRFPLSRKCSPRVPPEPLPQFGNRGSNGLSGNSMVLGQTITTRLHGHGPNNSPAATWYCGKQLPRGYMVLGQTITPRLHGTGANNYPAATW